MIDIKLIRENPDLIKQKITARGDKTDYVDRILLLDVKRRELIVEGEKLKSLRNRVSQEISVLKKEGKNTEDKIANMKKVSDDIKAIDEKLAETEKEIDKILIDIPNISDDSVPLGKSPEDNVQFKIWGEKPNGDFKYSDHVTLGKKLDILDFGIGAKITGSGFPFYKGKGAMLERALINFMLDSHKQNGYTEVFMPFLVNRASMEAAEKVPKFEEDMYKTQPDDLFAIPTAEVPIVNIHRDEILNPNDLPLKYCGYTACFRREAGSYGKETKGFLRVHQFNKVELINFCLPEDSFPQMEEMLNHACGILEQLNIHYRVVNLCTGDIGFASAKQYDIEVWSPAENKWLEASSVSNCTDFQSRRGMIRVKRDKKTEFVHILNGSGLATSRLYVSLIESNQTPEGKIVVPKVLHKYTGFEIIG
ncbi:MAG: serine--tRNA ligase [Chlorobi bacterium]|nr:serine--tRNA ligase [Chlorobiota bacterium]MCI0715249.1 serine--tRNA ligase [Chlorobiota bacterium]